MSLTEATTAYCAASGVRRRRSTAATTTTSGVALVRDDTRLFEKICLEGFQAGLSWLTILRKREAFRSAFAGFDIAAVAAFGDDDIERLVQDAGIVRHRGKIASTINNAQRCLELHDAGESLERGGVAVRTARVHVAPSA